MFQMMYIMKMKAMMPVQWMAKMAAMIMVITATAKK